MRDSDEADVEEEQGLVEVEGGEEKEREAEGDGEAMHVAVVDSGGGESRGTTAADGDTVGIKGVFSDTRGTIARGTTFLMADGATKAESAVEEAEEEDGAPNDRGVEKREGSAEPEPCHVGSEVVGTAARRASNERAPNAGRADAAAAIDCSSFSSSSCSAPC